MPDYLSDEWISSANDAVAALHCDGEIVIEYRVDDISYQLRLGPQTQVVSGSPVPADVTLTLDYRTAAAIATGERSAQSAFMSGDIRIGGDATVLVRAHEELGEVEEFFADLRSNTTYDDARVA